MRGLLPRESVLTGINSTRSRASPCPLKGFFRRDSDEKKDRLKCQCRVLGHRGGISPDPVGSPKGGSLSHRDKGRVWRPRTSSRTGRSSWRPGNTTRSWCCERTRQEHYHH